MYKLKTQLNAASVAAYLDAVEPEAKRNDAYAVLDIMRAATGQEPKMWGTSIVGFGQYHYKYESGHERDMCLVGFAPRKANMTLYLMLDGADYAPQLNQLGKHKVSKGCLYINKLADVHPEVLQELVGAAYKSMLAKHT